MEDLDEHRLSEFIIQKFRPDPVMPHASDAQKIYSYIFVVFTRRADTILSLDTWGSGFFHETISAASEEAAAASQQMAATTESLARLAEDLNQTVSVFKVDSAVYKA